MLQLVADNPNIIDSRAVEAMILDRAGPRYRLRRADGLYLHFTTEGFTPTKAWSWLGTKRQLANVRCRDDLSDLTVVKVNRR